MSAEEMEMGTLSPPTGQPQDVSEPTTEDTVDSGSNKATTSVLCVVTTASVVASVLAMVVAPVIIVYVAGGICCVNAITVGIRHRRIASLPPLRAVTNNLRMEATNLKEAVDVLTESVDDLENEVNDLKTTEEQFEKIVQEQGANATEFVELVKENEEILDAMKVNLRKDFISDVVNLVLLSDTSNDRKIDLKEGKMLALRLQTQLESHGIHLDTETFYEMLEENNDIMFIVKFCAEVAFPETAAEKMESEKAEESGASGKMSTEKKLGMISVSDKYCNGSALAAKGKGQTILPKGVAKTSRKTKAVNLVAVANKKVNTAEIV